MIRQLFFLNLASLSALPRAERWYWRVHSPQAVRKLGPWLTRYESYLSVPLPRGAEQVGAYNYRLSELWFRDWEALPGPHDLMWYDGHHEDRGLTSAPEGFYGGAYPVALEAHPPVQVNLPAIPTDEILGTDHKPNERPILRWVSAVRYRETAEQGAADEWYRTTRLPELADRSGAYRAFSSRALRTDNPVEAYDVPADDRWQRVDEFWFDNADQWHTAMIERSPRLSPAPWSAEDRSDPVERVSMFILERPDWILNDHRPFP